MVADSSILLFFCSVLCYQDHHKTKNAALALVSDWHFHKETEFETKKDVGVPSAGMICGRPSIVADVICRWANYG